jgi:hypothetical protein
MRVSLAETARESDRLSLPQVYQSLLLSAQLTDETIVRKIKTRVEAEDVTFSQFLQVMETRQVLGDEEMSGDESDEVLYEPMTVSKCR